jgi:CRISPR/Cas system-associated protein Cas10 (large subunit of type III CRISPR-Cas system)
LAYQILETNLLQSAIKAASAVTAALITAGDEDAQADAAGTMNTIAEDLFEQLKKQAEVDNEKLRKEADATPAPRRGGGSPPRRGGGGFRKPDAVKAAELELSWGAFKGMSIQDIYALSEEDAEQYGYQGSGKKYVNWLSNNKNNAYVADHAKAYLDSLKDGE